MQILIGFKGGNIHTSSFLHEIQILQMVPNTLQNVKEDVESLFKQELRNYFTKMYNIRLFQRLTYKFLMF